MDKEKLVDVLGDAWDEEIGFFFSIRNRKFERDKGVFLLKHLKEFSTPDGDLINKEMVRFIWYIPIYLEYQKENLNIALKKNPVEDAWKILSQIQAEVERILGYP